MRVIVAGAGIAGLTAAAGLRRDAHDVTVLERRLDTASGTAITLWPNALAALDTLSSETTCALPRRASAPVRCGGATGHGSAGPAWML